MPELTNPVRILRKIKGCVFEPGVEAGQTDINGDRYAQCTLKEGYVRVDDTTYPGNPRLFESPDGLRSDDSVKVIIGTDFLVRVLLDDGFGPAKVDVNEIAREVGGQLVPSNT